MKVTAGELDLEGAWESSGLENEGSFSQPLPEKTHEKIHQLIDALENHGDAQAVFESFSSDERVAFRNAITQHVSVGKDISAPGEEHQTFSYQDVISDLKMVSDANRGFFDSSYNIEQLKQEARRLRESEEKLRKTEKYASDLVAFLFAETESPDLIDFGKPIQDLPLQHTLRQLLFEHASSNWDSAFLANTEIPEEIKERLHAKISSFEARDSANQKHSNPRHVGKITESFLSMLNPEQQNEKIGEALEIQGKQYFVSRLLSRSELKKDSELLGHCVGNTDSYFHAIREGRKEIFSVRDGADIPLYTIAYDQADKAVSQLRGQNNISISPSIEDSEPILRILGSLETAGFPILAFREELNYALIKRGGAIVAESGVTLPLILDLLTHSREERIIKAPLIQVDDAIPQHELELLYASEGLTLDLTNVSSESKRSAESIKGDLVDRSDSAQYEKLQSVHGNMSFMNLSDASGLSRLEEIRGSASFMSIRSSSGFESLNFIGGDANFLNLEDSTNLAKLTSIGGNANFNSLTEVQGLRGLTTIGGYANFLNLRDAAGLEMLETIAGNADFPNLTTGEGLKLLKRIGGNANFTNLRDSNGLTALSEIGGNAFFINLENAGSLGSLVRVKGNANFNRLRHSIGLRTLETVGRNANFQSLNDGSDLVTLSWIGGSADFPCLLSSSGLSRLAYVGGSANFASLTETSGLAQLQHIGRHSYFFGLSQDQRMKIPALRNR